jgi:hypothetical protein
VQLLLVIDVCMGIDESWQGDPAPGIDDLV